MKKLLICSLLIIGLALIGMAQKISVIALWGEDVGNGFRICVGPYPTGSIESNLHGAIWNYSRGWKWEIELWRVWGTDDQIYYFSPEIEVRDVEYLDYSAYKDMKQGHLPNSYWSPRRREVQCLPYVIAKPGDHVLIMVELPNNSIEWIPLNP